MSTVINQFKQPTLSRPALLVPLAIVLIFSVFNLTAPQDGARIAAEFKIGIVNQDDGLAFPPIRIASKVMEGLVGNMPFQVMEIADPDTARSALEAGDVAAVILFAPEFSKNAFGDDNFEVEIWNAQHLTIGQTQIAAQLPAMMQMALSAGVASLRLAFAKGRLPSGEMPVSIKVETLHKAANSVVLAAPFVMNFATWLATFVGAMLLFLASREMSASSVRAKIRVGLPVVSFGLASLGLAVIVVATTGQWDLFLPVWLNVWAVALCLGWLLTGLFSLLGIGAIVLILPVVFYQNALGGTMAPIGAAPPWLGSIAGLVPFERIGAGYRGVVHGAGFDLPLVWLAGAGTVGLVLIAVRAAMDGAKHE
jgi:hypothetical protein